MRAQAYSQAAPVVKDVADTATPYVRKGLEVAGEVAAPVVKAAEPIVKVRVVDCRPAPAWLHRTAAAWPRLRRSGHNLLKEDCTMDRRLRMPVCDASTGHRDEVHQLSNRSHSIVCRRRGWARWRASWRRRA